MLSDTPQTTEKPVVMVLTHGEDKEVEGWGDPEPEEAQDLPMLDWRGLG